MKKILLTACLVGCMATAAFAQSPAVGEEAPEIGAGSNWVMNTPSETKIADLRGDVIVLEHWGIRSQRCRRLIPHMQGLHVKSAARGLHIFTFERQGNTGQMIREAINGRGGAGYAVSAGGNYNYKGTGGIPIAWVIGVDGKVVYVGYPGRSAFDEVIEAELAKVKYPGLGKLDIHEDVEIAAKKFIASDWGGALREADKVLAEEDGEELALSDAKFLVEKITARYQQMVDAAQKAEGEKRYVQAKGIYEQICELFGRRSGWGSSAKDKLLEYKRDWEIMAEIKAEHELEKLKVTVAAMKDSGAPADRLLKAVEKFVKKHEGSAAAQRANDELGAIINGRDRPSGR